VRSKVITLALALMLVGAVSLAAAKSSGDVKTIISVDKVVQEGKHKILVAGRLHASKPACRRGRTVRFDGVGNFPDDIDRSSRDGAFAGIIYVAPSDPFGVEAKGTTLGPPGDRTKCKRAFYLSG
jgi:hypothetical protein